ncbi:MAG TPA: hypothetical protein VKN74_06300 [Candidatus Mcinerneyibacterium sp.]|nr:hypothetical protein [Candidatus Mcinerneyibacterium sp.]
MIYVKKGDKKYPFSKGIMARSLTRAGISVESSYEIVEKIRKELQTKDIEEIPSRELIQKLCDELKDRGRIIEEKFYRVSKKIKYMKKPLFILIGGGSGVGKSTISSAIGHRLDINRVIGSDTIREIMRSILTRNLIPALHESSFEAGDSLGSLFIKNRLLYGFEQQASLVKEGVLSVIRRGIKEGLNMVINGVHIIPGILKNEISEESAHVFQYVLDVADEEKHIRNFYSREEDSARNPARYIKKINKIRKLQNYLNQRANNFDVRIITNRSFETTLKIILEDIINTLEKEIEK